MKKHQAGFAHVLILVLVLIVVSAVGFALWRVTASNDTQTSSLPEEVSSKSPKIKHLGINLDYFDATTGKAGDITFTKLPAVEGGLEAPFLEYGRFVPESSAGPARRNPQPTFVAPLGTKVHAIADGEVVNVTKLYSNDYSVHVQANGSDIVFETEHVINVVVKAGDRVTAGQEIAEVSDYDARNLGGLGLFEIGVLVPGNPPSHVCAFDYLDESIKDETLKKISALQDSWEKYIGSDSIYDQASAPIAGCASRDAVEG